MKQIQSINEYYSYKKIISIFFIELSIFQIIAFLNYGNIKWIIVDYLWYAFIFLGLIDAIILAKRNLKSSLKESILSSLNRAKKDMFNTLEIQIRHNSIDEDEVTEYIYYNGHKIHIPENKTMLLQMKSYHNSILLKIKEDFNNLSQDVDFDNSWSDDFYNQLLELIRPKRSDFSIVVGSKKMLQSSIKNYHKIHSAHKDIIHSQKLSNFEDFMISFTPFLLSFVIAMQLGNVTNRFLQYYMN